MKGKASEKKSLEYDPRPSLYVKDQDSTEKKCHVISQYTFHYPVHFKILGLELGEVSLLSYKYVSLEVLSMIHIKGWW